ncbi:hypothetical protein ACFQ4L_01805 [Lapidilactobacillus mulanensis]|uniref:Uncharacterized protein n=1 Tax=Lapidilactobacillus mulanensis TaxID=2485999 RepID=A0ABW4DJH6_9LACO
MEEKYGHTVKLVLASDFCSVTAGGAFEIFVVFKKLESQVEEFPYFGNPGTVPTVFVHTFPEQLRPKVDKIFNLFNGFDFLYLRITIFRRK